MMATVSVKLDFSPHTNLSRYLHQIRQFPMLEVNQEIELAKNWQNHQDSSAAHLMVCSHLRLVVKIAMKFRGYGLPVGDLISEGNVGMMKAISRFDYERGYRLSTYAMWWIRASIQEYILHSWSLVKMGTTAAQKKLFFNLRKLKGKMQLIEEGEMRPDHVNAIAECLDVSETEVVSMNRRMSGSDQSLNAPLHEANEGEWQDWLVDDTDSQEIKLAEKQELNRRRKLLAKAMKNLSDRERYIVVKRRLDEEWVTLQELSEEFSISRERIRQIEAIAFDKLQKSIKNAEFKQNMELC